jgi:CTP synthase (UTP-ammonia lyase)
MNKTGGSEIRIAVSSDFSANNAGHQATSEALGHASRALGLPLAVNWIPTEVTATKDGAAVLADYDGVYSAGGAYTDKNGALAAIRFAREREWPFLGT